MTEAAAFRSGLFLAGAAHFKGNQLKQSNILSTRRKLKIEGQVATPSTYSSRISTDIPLYEVPGASFDQYLEDKPRVFTAIFPDKQRSQQLNEDEWKVHMLPIDFLFLTVYPVVDMRIRCKSNGIEYPPAVPRDVSKVLELEIVRWELQGLDDMLKPSQFSLGVNGALYSDRRGSRSRLKGQLQMSISFVLPPVLGLVPENIRRDVAESVLKRLVENMKQKVNGSLIADYSKFKRERPKTLRIQEKFKLAGS
ncbi:hypothetical protein F511_01433 [Dorcoceras hygrometricum]|uniref:DUF1997 family protein n=1 Tax=Dorcoceras hygrometricum TaxID=472368 RepID=A0A2Z7BF00_9LAMI|nr:hypothetical protein F511_01433 [Dorcoceras hygrometricum]